MRDTALDARLASVSALVRQDAILADIGTDHAYLPIFLLRSGRISRAILADINEGPLASAKEHIDEAGLLNSVEFCLTDGAAALADTGATDYTICGMGGELIADIIAGAPHLSSADIRLILQPMTRQGALRRYLYENGFDILSESYSFSDGKFYLAMLAGYTGVKKEIDEIDAEVGICKEIIGKDAYSGYVNAKIRQLERITQNKMRAGADTGVENRLLERWREAVLCIK